VTRGQHKKKQRVANPKTIPGGGRENTKNNEGKGTQTGFDEELGQVRKGQQKETTPKRNEV